MNSKLEKIVVCVCGWVDGVEYNLVHDLACGFVILFSRY
jgi:hypothetical protein